MQRMLAAAITGVLVVGCAAPPSGTSTSTGTSSAGSSGATPRAAGQVDDSAIGAKIKAALAADAELSALKITVDSSQGAVRLKGEVKTIALWRKADALVRNVEGVKSVDNQLIITG